MYRKFRMILCIIMVLGLTLVGKGYGQGKMINNERIVGGECNYTSYPGEARIVSVIKKPGTESPVSFSYEIRFTFHSDHVIKEPFARTEGKTYLLLHANSYPDDGFIKQHDIAKDRVYPCVMKVIVKGTCTPVIFEFPTMEKHQ